jgi:hypothetical protein
LPTDDQPIRAHDAFWDVTGLEEDARRLEAEAVNFLAEVKRRGPTRALRLRGRRLRKQIKAQGSKIDRMFTFQFGCEIAFRERCGRDPVEDVDIITPADEERAARFVAMSSKASTC